MAASYCVGMRVDGLYDENQDDMWYPGCVQRVHYDDSANSAAFEVLYDDGEVELRVPPAFLRLHVPGTLCVGTRVLCRYHGGTTWFHGQIVDVQENGKYSIVYDDGKRAQDVPMDHIVEPTDDKRGTSPMAQAEDKDREPNNATTKLGVSTQGEHDHPQQASKDMESSTVHSHAVARSRDANGFQVPKECDVTDPATSVLGPSVPVNPEQAHLDDCRPNDEHFDGTNVGAACTYIHDSLELLETQGTDPTSTTSALVALITRIRAHPQATAAHVSSQGGDRLILDALKVHPSHAVLQCYGFVLLRRLCRLCRPSLHLLVHHGMVAVILDAMHAFPADAILQAAACGALAAFTRIHAGLQSLVDCHVADVVLSTLSYHKTYSVQTRQVHYYGCEVLLELCALNDCQTLTMLCGHYKELGPSTSPIALLVELLRQGQSLDDKKTCCAVGTLLMCIAASGASGAGTILQLEGLAALATVLTRYPSEPSILKYASAASDQFARCSIQQLPVKLIKTVADGTRRAASHTVTETRTQTSPCRRFKRGTGKRTSNGMSGYDAPTSPRGVKGANDSHRGFTHESSVYVHAAMGSERERHAARFLKPAASAVQPPSSLVVLDGTGRCELPSTYTQLSKEDRQKELYKAYGMPNVGIKRPPGCKHSRQRVVRHVASDHTWARPQANALPLDANLSPWDPSDRDRAALYHDAMYHRQKGDAYQGNALLDSIGGRACHQATSKTQSRRVRTAFHVQVEKDNQLHVVKDAHLCTVPPRGLGVATKRAAKARQKRLSGTNPESRRLERREVRPSRSLNDYATHLFQYKADSRGTTISSGSLRDNQEIPECERLSFAEKLHMMIDRAKSTLATGSGVSAPVERHSSPSATATTRNLYSVSTHQQQEAFEPRLATPTCASATRPSRAGGATSAPRPKLGVSRPQKTISENKARAGARNAKASMDDNAQGLTESMITVKTVWSSNAIAESQADRGERDGDVRDDDIEALSVDTMAVLVETIATIPLEPKGRNRAEGAKGGLQFNDTVSDFVEVTTRVANGENDNVGLMSVPVNGKEEEFAINTACDWPPIDGQQSREYKLNQADGHLELHDEQPSADAHSECDNNGVNEDRMATKANEVLATGTKTLAASVLQESKSEGALYEDDSDAFDEDETDQREEITAADDVESGANVWNGINKAAVDGVADNVEREDTNLADEEEFAVVTEQREEDEKLGHKTDVNDRADDAVESRVVSKEDKELGPVNMKTTPMLESYKQGNDTHVDLWGTVTDASLALDYDAEIRNSDEAHKYETGEELGALATNAHANDGGDRPRVLHEDVECLDPFIEPGTLIHSATDEAEVSSSEHNEGTLSEDTNTKAEAEENQSEASMELSVDSSTHSLQSGVYDEDNFDDEEMPAEGQSVAVESNDTIEHSQDADWTDALAGSSHEGEEPRSLAGASSELGVAPGAENGVQESPTGNTRHMLELLTTEKAKVGAPREADPPADEAVAILEWRVAESALDATSRPYEDREIDCYNLYDEVRGESVQSRPETTDEGGGYEEQESQDVGDSKVEDRTLRCDKFEGKKVMEPSDDVPVACEADVVQSTERECISAADASDILEDSSDDIPVGLAERELFLCSAATALVSDEVDTVAISKQPAAEDDNVGENEAAKWETTSMETGTQGLEAVEDDVVGGVAADTGTLKGMEVPTVAKTQAESHVEEVRSRLVENAPDSRASVDGAVVQVMPASGAFADECLDLLAVEKARLTLALDTVDTFGPGAGPWEAATEQSAGHGDVIALTVYTVEPESAVAPATGDMARYHEAESEEAGLEIPEPSANMTLNDNTDNKDPQEKTFARGDSTGKAVSAAETVESDVNDECAYEEAECYDSDPTAAEDGANELTSVSTREALPADNAVAFQTKSTRTETARWSEEDATDLASSGLREQEGGDLLAVTHVNEEDTADNIGFPLEDRIDKQVGNEVVAETVVEAIMDGDQDVASLHEDLDVARDESVATNEPHDHGLGYGSPAFPVETSDSDQAAEIDRRRHVDARDPNHDFMTVILDGKAVTDTHDEEPDGQLREATVCEREVAYELADMSSPVETVGRVETC